VLVLGDSMVVGFGVEAHESMPALLEDELHAARPELALRVLNAGVAGYSPSHEEALLVSLLPRTRPWLVVCVFYDGNDLPDARGHREQLGRLAVRPRNDYAERPLTLFEREYWWRYSQLFAFVEARLAERFPGLGLPRPIHAYDELGARMRREPSPIVREELELVTGCLVGMRRRCAAADVGFLVVRLPARTQVEPRTYARLLERRGLDPAEHARELPGSAVLAGCRAAGVETLDLLPLLEWPGEGRSPDYFFEGHLDRPGNRRVAAAVAGAVLERLPAPAGR
jgi:hypothetical protein